MVVPDRTVIYIFKNCYTPGSGNVVLSNVVLAEDDRGWMFSFL